jgi:hypothetical protein
MQKVENLTDALKGMVNTARELASYTGNDDQKVPSFWIRTTDEFSKAITEKTIYSYNNTINPDNADYENKVTPHELRFPGIKSKICDIYEAEEDELCKEFMYKVDGKMKVNSDWIKINREIDEEEFCKEDIRLIQSIRENGGYRITIKEYNHEDRKKGKVDVELPLSNIFRAAQWVDSKKICLNPRYPFVFFFYMMNLFKFSVPSDKISDNIQKIIDDLWDRRDTLLNKSTGPTNDAMKTAQSAIAGFMGGNQEIYNQITSTINSQLDQALNDDTIDHVVSECDKAISAFTSNNNQDLAQTISGIAGYDEKVIRETMDKFKLSETHIKKYVDKVSGGMSNDDLLSSIPKDDNTPDIDTLLKQMNS